MKRLALVACLLVLTAGCSSGDHPPREQPPGPAPSAGQGAITDGEYAAALAIAQREAHQGDATVTNATVRVGSGTVTQSNTGYACESGRLLHIKLIGTFPDIVTTGFPIGRGSRTPSADDFTVHAVLLTADTGSGRVCLQAVQTGDVSPRPGATTLAID
jgi:hypothetical protein